MIHYCSFSSCRVIQFWHLQALTRCQWSLKQDKRLSVAHSRCKSKIRCWCFRRSERVALMLLPLLCGKAAAQHEPGTNLQMDVRDRLG